MTLTDAERRALRQVAEADERVDWAAYDRAKAKIASLPVAVHKAGPVRDWPPEQGKILPRTVQYCALCGVEIRRTPFLPYEAGTLVEQGPYHTAITLRAKAPDCTP